MNRAIAMHRGWNRFFDGRDTVLALPSWSAPRLLIVSRSARQRWMDSAAYYPAFRIRARIFKFLLRLTVAFLPNRFQSGRKTKFPAKFKLAVAAFLDGHFQSFRHSATGQSLFPEYFEERGFASNVRWDNEPVLRGELLPFICKVFTGVDRCVVLTGSTPHRKKKMIAQARDSKGDILGYLKYGETPEAQACIVSEAVCLSALPGKVGPQCIGLEQHAAYTCMALTAVKGRMLEARLPQSFDGRQLSVIKEYLERLQISDITFGIDVHPSIVRLREQVTVLSSQSSVFSLQDFEEILASLRTQKWPVVIQHGDFTPWNVLRVREEKDVGCRMEVDKDFLTTDNVSIINSTSRLCAIDWEEGTTEGLPWLDLIYFCLQTGYLMHHWSAEQTTSYALNVLTFNGLNEQVAVSLIKLSALDAWLRNEEYISGSELQQFRQSVWGES
jgi:hypothetical protein